ncbi:MAG: amidohydrolase [Deltaproteobacteria bacterium]|nr:amidohydrolase [Deltaproteobacteria bacterium]
MTHGHPDIIIQGGTLVTMVDGQDPIENATISIKKDTIIDIRTSGGKSPSVEAGEVIDAKNTIIMPGLINSHSHAAMTLLRGYADDLPLNQWLFEKIFPAEAKYLNEETVYWGALLGCLEMIASGTTCLADGYFFQGATVRAVHRAGLRGLIAQGIIDFPAPGVGDPKRNLEIGREFIQRWIGFSDLITPGLFCHSPVTCGAKTLSGALEISRNYSLPLQIHLSETVDEVEEIQTRTGRRPVQYLADLGLLNHQLITAHSVHLNMAELDLLLDKDVKVVHVPESNMKLSSGVASISDMIKIGLKIGIGTDGCASNNNLDLFEEMDTASKLAKVFTLDPTSANAETVLKMATSWGARIMGLESLVGTIEKGKKADIIIIDLERPHMVPLYHPISQIVYSANGADVRDVIVNGKILMKNREFQTLDAQEIMDRVKLICRRMKV